MPSPIGHALAGLAVASSASRISPGRLDQSVSRTLPIACVALAVFPDLDLIYWPIHRTATHSFAATAFITIVAAAVTGWVTGRVNWWLAVVCGVAHLSHILLDWLGQDLATPAGIQMLWPFSDRWFISGWDVFRGTQRRDVLSLETMVFNLKTGALEILTLAPIVLALRFVRRPTQDPPSGRSPQTGRAETRRT